MPRGLLRASCDGRVFLEERVALVFFFARPHTEIAAGVRRALDWFVARSEPLAWIGGKGVRAGHQALYAELTPRKLAAVRKRLDAPREDDEHIVLRDQADESALPRHRFHYHADAASLAPGSFRYPCAGLELWLPAEGFLDGSANDRAEALLELAGALPFTSGYASLAIGCEGYPSPDEHTRFVREAARRHPGLDRPCTETVRMFIRERVRGAYWLTFLSPEVLARVPTLTAAPPPGVTVHDLGEGRVALRAGPRPELGDLDAADCLPALRALAAALWPVQLVQTYGFSGGLTPADEHRWQLRHHLPPWDPEGDAEDE